MKTLNPLVFKILLDNATFLFNEDEDTAVEFKADFGDNEITAYLSNDLKIKIEDFGYIKADKWIQCEPNNNQLEAIHSRMVIELDAHDFLKTYRD